MSVSSVRRRMTHRAVVERDTTVARDALGGKQKPVWASHIASQVCFFYREGRKDSMEAVRTRGTILHDRLRLLVPLRDSAGVLTDITEKDRINGVTGRDGTVIEAGYMTITAVTNAHTHLELRVEKVA